MSSHGTQSSMMRRDRGRLRWYAVGHRFRRDSSGNAMANATMAPMNNAAAAPPPPPPATATNIARTIPANRAMPHAAARLVPVSACEAERGGAVGGGTVGGGGPTPYPPGA